MSVCNWVEAEMEKLNTGDKRLDKRTKGVLKAIGDKPSLSFTQQFQSAGELKSCYRLYPMFSLFLIVAWRINNLSRISRIHPDLPCTIIFSEQEWKAAY